MSPIVNHGRATTLTTATLGDHLAAQGIETNELYSRGARLRKREAPTEAKEATPTHPKDRIEELLPRHVAAELAPKAQAA
jgi:hypothetical protein